MTAEPRNILAGIGALDDAFQIAWFADSPATGPTTPTEALDSAFKSLGIVSEDGLTVSTNISSTGIGAYGTYSDVRTLITGETITFKVTGRETNVYTKAIQARLAIGSAPTPSAGVFSVTRGPARDALYAAVFHATDGSNIVRKYAPSVRLTGVDDEQTAKAANIAYGFTFTAYPDSSGNTLYEYIKLASLLDSSSSSSS